MSTPAAPSAPAPYRLLFPLGALFAIAGVLPWPLHAMGLTPWPGPLHAGLMIQGFELCFVLGFLLTSIPAFTHGEPATALELGRALLGPLAFGIAAAFGAEALALAAFTLTLLGLGIAVAARVTHAKVKPAEEFLFVGVGLVLGLAGAVSQLGAALGLWSEPAPRFGLHLVSLGMVLALVLGVGSLLVPVFAGIRDPLVIPGVAGPHDRAGRRPLYLGLAAALAASFMLDAFALPRFAAILRALVATVFVALVWKLVRPPGRRAIGAWAMWAAGWLVVLGLLLAAVFPFHAVALEHLVFIGGYGLLTLAIGTRVVVGHGRHPVTDEGKVLTIGVVAMLAIALALRLAAEWLSPAGQLHTLATASAFWILAWVLWAVGALPRIVRVGKPAMR